MENKGPSGRERLFAYAPFVVWIIVVLVLGSSQGSSAQTSRFIRPIIEFFFPNAAPDTFLLIHAFIRKTAHFVEYGILAMLAARAFSGPSSTLMRRRWAWISIGAVAAVACIDELTQSFLTTRTGSVLDFLLDLAGGLTGLALYYLARRRSRGALAEAVD